MNVGQIKLLRGIDASVSPYAALRDVYTDHELVRKDYRKRGRVVPLTDEKHLPGRLCLWLSPIRDCLVAVDAMADSDRQSSSKRYCFMTSSLVQCEEEIVSNFGTNASIITIHIWAVFLGGSVTSMANERVTLGIVDSALLICLAMCSS
jgi:hypothetical protein